MKSAASIIATTRSMPSAEPTSTTFDATSTETRADESAVWIACVIAFAQPPHDMSFTSSFMLPLQSI